MAKGKKNHSDDKKVSIIRLVYLYIISAITFIVFLIGAVSLVNLGLKVFIFDIQEDYYRPESPVMVCERYSPIVKETEEETEYDKLQREAYEECLEKQRKREEEQESRWISQSVARDLSIGIAQVLVALPLWLFHWRIIERDRKKRLTRGRTKK
ncbi:hypothetical protein GF369_02865 [Candidatus Peregrinibacteria bacterium]|nr:hypothetical protein [Candidatus Peregrinibacteria bacterium]